MPERTTPHHLTIARDNTQVVGYMRKFARDAAHDVKVIGLVKKILAGIQNGDYNAEIYACYAWVHANVRYQKDPDGVEMVQTPACTIRERSGDCDDMATLLAGMLLACGHQCRFALVGFHQGGAPSHVYVEALLPDGGYATLDPVANYESSSMLGRVQTKRVARV